MPEPVRTAYEQANHDHLIQIGTNCHDYTCALVAEFCGCMFGWDDGNEMPSPKCPGPGKYRLVRVEEGGEA